MMIKNLPLVITLSLSCAGVGMASNGGHDDFFRDFGRRSSPSGQGNMNTGNFQQQFDAMGRQFEAMRRDVERNIPAAERARLNAFLNQPQQAPAVQPAPAQVVYQAPQVVYTAPAPAVQRPADNNNNVNMRQVVEPKVVEVAKPFNINNYPHLADSHRTISVFLPAYATDRIMETISKLPENEVTEYVQVLVNLIRHDTPPSFKGKMFDVMFAHKNLSLNDLKELKKQMSQFAWGLMVGQEMPESKGPAILETVTKFMKEKVAPRVAKEAAQAEQVRKVEQERKMREEEQARKAEQERQAALERKQREEEQARKAEQERQAALERKQREEEQARKAEQERQAALERKLREEEQARKAELNRQRDEQVRQQQQAVQKQNNEPARQFNLSRKASIFAEQAKLVDAAATLILATGNKDYGEAFKKWVETDIGSSYLLRFCLLQNEMEEVKQKLSQLEGGNYIASTMDVSNSTHRVYLILGIKHLIDAKFNKDVVRN